MEALNDRVAAIEISSSSVRAVVLEVDRAQPVLLRSSEIAIDPPGSREKEGCPLYRACQKALGQLRDEVVVSTVDATDLLVRRLRLEVTKDREIEQALAFQVEPLLPFPLEEAVLAHAVVSRDREGADVVVLTVPKERLRAHIEQLAAGGVEPERTSCIPAALAALLFRLLPSAEAQGVLHLGDEATTCALVRQGQVLGCRAVACGLKQLLDAGDGLCELDFSRLEPADGFKVYQRAEALRSEVARAFYALTSEKKGGPTVTQIFITGASDSLHNLDLFFSRALDLPLTRLPDRSPFCSPLGDVTRFAVPLGLALQALPLRTPRIDFRKAEFAYAHPWRRPRRRLLFYLGFCTALAGGLLAYGMVQRSHHQLALRREYEALCQHTENLLPSLGSSDLPPPKTLAEITEATQRLGAQLQSLPQTHPLAPAVPRVSDVLAWLATHPRLVQIDPLSGKETPLIALQSLHYLMVNRPTPKRSTERYRVRVDLEFTAESPTVARELHHALLEPNPFIDAKSELKWTQSRGFYRASFFLSDKTFYPEATT
jgi:type IV pilus assembly protein PilM